MHNQVFEPLGPCNTALVCKWDGSEVSLQGRVEAKVEAAAAQLFHLPAVRAPKHEQRATKAQDCLN